VLKEVRIATYRSQGTLPPLALLPGVDERLWLGFVVVAVSIGKQAPWG